MLRLETVRCYWLDKERLWRPEAKHREGTRLKNNSVKLVENQAICFHYSKLLNCLKQEMEMIF